MKNILKIGSVVVGLLAIFLYYYIYLPVINIHSSGLWIFVISLVFIGAGVYRAINFNSYDPKVLRSIYIAGGVLTAIYMIGSVLSSPIINAKKYQALINITDSDFNSDIKEISYSEIPIVDKATAINLGSREMGSMVDLVSQFEVSELYTQINYNQKPTRVTPLEYGNLFKWFTNRKEGIPAYMSIDMATQDINLIMLSEGIKYSFSEPLNRNVNRYLRFNYPTYIFDTINFEIDDSGIPYWVCPVRTYTIGLFGGPVIKKVILLNAITGEFIEYEIEEVPQWIDTVYSANLLIDYYNYYGTLKNGFFNSILGQKGVLRTTNGYNYIAMNDDVYVYTGITSVSADQSNVGFVLMNQRTAETKYYTISGAQETSAMASAQGQVQHLGYTATFPILLNISDQPTYFMALKDSAGLVKKYAMVNIEKYQIVATGDTVLECEENYIKLMQDNNIEVSEYSIGDSDLLEVSGKITYLEYITVDGNTHIVIQLDSDTSQFYLLPIKADLSDLTVLNYRLNNSVLINYYEQEAYNLVVSID